METIIFFGGRTGTSLGQTDLFCLNAEQKKDLSEQSDEAQEENMEGMEPSMAGVQVAPGVVCWDVFSCGNYVGRHIKVIFWGLEVSDKKKLLKLVCKKGNKFDSGIKTLALQFDGQ